MRDENETAGDEIRQRLETTWRAKRRGLVAHARSRTGDADEAEDLVQDVLLRALGNLPALVNVQNLGAWLYAAVRNRAVDRWRHEAARRRAGETDPGEELLEEIVAGAGLDPHDSLVREELNDALAEAIGLLPPEQRRVIEAQVFEGLSYRELAARSGESADTLAARKRYAVKALQRTLREWIED
jgi:RNA polymerase sigma factor (sigma-70 family)